MLKKTTLLIFLIIPFALSAQKIYTVVGGNYGVCTFQGDNSLALQAGICTPSGVAVDYNGDVYFSDTGNNRIRKISYSTGVITTIAGNGTPGSSGDGGLAINASVSPSALDVDGTMLVFTEPDRIRMIDLSSGFITTIAGGVTATWTNGGPLWGDGGPATSAVLYYPGGVKISGSKIYITDAATVVRAIDLSTGIISLVAGSSSRDQFSAGDGGPALAASFDNCTGIEADGNYIYVAETNQNRIRVIDRSGIINSLPELIGGAGQLDLYQGNLIISTLSLIYKYGPIFETPPVVIAGNVNKPTLNGVFQAAVDQNTGVTYISQQGVDLISKLQAPVTITAAQLVTKYDGNPHPLQYTTNPSGVAITETYGLAPLPNWSPTPPLHGGIWDAYLLADDAIYGGSLSQHVVIQQVPLTVTANSVTRTYGQPLPVFTISYSGFIGSESPSVLDVPPTAICSTLPLNNPPYVTSYPITFQGTPSDNDYAMNLITGVYTVTQAPLLVQADNKSRPYNTANPALTMTYSGFVYGESPSELNAIILGSFVQPSISTTAVTSSLPGVYPITLSGGQTDNYYFSSLNAGTFTITPLSNYITFLPLTTRCPNATFSLTAASSSGLPVTYSSSDNSIATISGNVVTTLAPGTVTITASSGDNIYATVTSQQNLIVKPLPVPTITSAASPCQGASGLQYSTEIGMTGYYWNVSAGGSITSGSGTSVVTVSWNKSGAQTIGVTYTGTNSCTGSSTIPVNVGSLPIPTVSGNAITCTGQSGNVYTTETLNNNYRWTVVNGSITAGGTAMSSFATVTWNLAGAQTISINYATPVGCSAAASTVKNVTVYSTPSSAITGPSTVCSNVGVNLTAPSGTGYTYLWSTGATTQSISTLTGGTYGVTVSSNGCTSSSSVVLTEPTPVFTSVVLDGAAVSGICTGSITLANGTHTISVTPTTGVVFSFTDPHHSVLSQSTSGGTVTFLLHGSSPFSANITAPSGSCQMFGCVCFNNPGSNCGGIAARTDQDEPVRDTVVTENHFSVFPNPANKTITVSIAGNNSTAATPIYLYDLSGRLLIAITINDGESEKIISTEEFSAGMYLIRIKENSKDQYRKIVVLH